MKRSIVALLVMFVLALLALTPVQARQADTTATGIQIVDAKIGGSIANREIGDEAASFAKDAKVYLWMKVEGGTDQQLTVTWTCGDYTHTATLDVKGSPWRTWAEKTVRQTGDWTVTVTGADGKELKKLTFKVE